MTNILLHLQENLWKSALHHQEKAYAQCLPPKPIFIAFFENDNGFVFAHYHEAEKIEEKIQNDLGVTLRCFPLDNQTTAPCIFTKKTKGVWRFSPGHIDYFIDALEIYNLLLAPPTEIGFLLHFPFNSNLIF